MPLADASDAVLIFRTVSIEKLDGVLTACRARWPHRRLAVLSSAGRRGELLADPRVAEVIVAEPGPNGYASDLRLERRFAAVIVPVGNHGGSGYANILRAAANCPADEYHLAPYAGALRSATSGQLRRRAACENLLLAVCLPIGWLLALRRFRT